MGDLTKNFSSDEMRCRCGCDICNVDEMFMSKLQTVRSLLETPIVIASGCRCHKHNINCGGGAMSDHITTSFIKCEGVDVRCNNSALRLKIIQTALLVGIKRIGIAKTFIHLGTKKSNPQNVIWVY